MIGAGGRLALAAIGMQAALLLGSVPALAQPLPPAAIETAEPSPPAGEPPPPASVPEPRAPLPPPEEMARCKALIDAGQYAAARARLQPIVDRHPGWARAAALLGLTYYRENRFELAKPLFAKALVADPDEIAARPLYGWSLYSLGELDEAQATFESLLERKPDYAPAHYALGLIHLDRDQIDDARKRFEAAVRLASQQADAPMEGRAHARLGDLYVREGDLAAAKRELTRAIELFPEEHEAKFKLSRVLQRLGDEQGAEAARTGSEAVTARARPKAEAAPLRFTPVPGSAGIDLVMTSGRMPSREILEVNGGGIALLDYDGDGDLDVFLANGATLDDPEHGPGSRLYANHGDGTFEDVTGRAGIALRRWAMGAAVGDYDGDGWDDLYVTCYGPDVLLRNEAGDGGGRRFRDVSKEAGVADDEWSTSAAFADLDADGDLDLYVVNYLDFDPAHLPDRAGKAFKGVPVMAGPRGLAAQPDRLYENLGNGRFRDVTRAAGCRVDTGLDYGLTLRIFDFDSDGRPDVFVGNDSTENQLFRNRGGLAFEEVAAVAGVAANGLGTTQATMGVGQVDADGNGLLDLFLTVFSDDTNTLQLNLGNGLFDDRSAQFGLAAASRPYLGWGCGFYDFDLDGDEDLFIANGHVYPEMDDLQVGGTWAQQPLLFARRGERFEVASCGEPWCERRYHGRATAFGDLDGDRDVDVLMTTLNGPVEVLRNDAPAGRSLVVRIEAPPPNRHGIGSTVEVETSAGTQRRWITGGGSYQSVDAFDAYFGLGSAAETEKVTLRVRGPDGAMRAFKEIPTGSLVVFRGR